MKKVLLQITGEEIDEARIQNEITINCSNEEELYSICESLCKIIEENKTFRDAFHATIVPRIAKKIVSSMEDIEGLKEMEGQFPDFDEIVKNAKVNPNKNIKEN